MAITLDSMVFNATLSQPPRVSSSVQADLATGAFDLASKRIGQQVSATNVQLSAFGQIKSSYVDIQSAAMSLSAPGKSSSTEDTTKVVQAFAEAFNKASQAVNSAIRGGVDALASGGHATLAALDLKKIVSSGNNANDLKKIGVNVNKDGTISVDAKSLQSAIQANPSSVKDTLAKIGAQAEQVAGKELASNGNIGGSVNALSARAQYLEATALAQQKLAAASQSAVQQQVANLDQNVSGGVAAYMQMLSL